MQLFTTHIKCEREQRAELRGVEKERIRAFSMNLRVTMTQISTFGNKL